MAHCCSQCSFTANFESALRMHHELHHESSSNPVFSEVHGSFVAEKSRTFPRNKRPFSGGYKQQKPVGHTSSAHRLFERLRTRICGSRHALFAHPEHSLALERDIVVADPISSEDTSKGGLLADSRNSVLCNRDLTLSSPSPGRETYACHLCSYVADRITVLDRHLLNQHKMSLDNLLKLVLAKTKDCLSEQQTEYEITSSLPYYKPQIDELEEGEFISETETPKIKILRNVATNTDLKWCDIPDLKDNCRIITDELEKLITSPAELPNKDDLLVKMKTLNDVMCRFADSTNTLKKVIAKESFKKSRHSVQGRLSSIPEPLYNLGLGDPDPGHGWDRAHSENYVRNRHRPDKMSSESFYF